MQTEKLRKTFWSRYSGLGGKLLQFSTSRMPETTFYSRICPGRYVAEQSIWAIVVSILATLHISKAKNELGNEIDVSPEFTPGIVSCVFYTVRFSPGSLTKCKRHPKPFPCSIVPRSSKVEQLIRMNNSLDE